MTEDHGNVYRVEVGNASCLDVEVREPDVILRGGDTDALVASLMPGGSERGQPVGLDIHQEGDTVFIRGIDDQRLSRQSLIVEVPSAFRAIHARTGNGDLSVSRLAEVELDLRTGKGDAQLTELSDRIHLEAGCGDIEARALSGRIELSTGAGDIDISETSGEWIKLHTGSGDVAIEGVTGNTLCKVGQGDVATRNLAGQAEITTGSGDVALSAQDNLKALVSTGAGDINVHKGSLRELKAHTGAGDVTLQADLLEGQFDLTSSSGDLSVIVRPDANVRFEATTGRGDLVSDVPGVKVGRPGPASPAAGRLVGVLGDGRAQLSLRTGKGDVRIRFPKKYRREAASMRREAARMRREARQEMRHSQRIDREAIRAQRESFRVAMESAREAVLATKEPLKEALDATRETIETSLHQGTASVLRATEEALRTTTSALLGIEETLQDLRPWSDEDDEGAATPDTSPTSSAAEEGAGVGPEGAEQPPAGNDGSPPPEEGDAGRGTLEDTLQAAKGKIMSSLSQVSESAIHAWGEALRAVEGMSSGHKKGEEVSASQPTDAEEVVVQETAGESMTVEGQAAPEEESTTMGVLEALEAGEIDVDEAECLLSRPELGERESAA